MAGFISIGDMMRHMKSGAPFSIVYITYNHTTGKGGAVKNYPMATICWVRDEEDNPERSIGLARGRFIKNPNHFHNSTANIRITGPGPAEIKKVHIQLIRQYNGAIVK